MKEAAHWDRQYLISRTSVETIRSELRHLKGCIISTPDSEASYKNINDILERLKGA